MPNTVQDRVKTEWEKAQELGGQRASRIRDILGAAATEALAEIKEGSGEIETQGRKTLADMIEQLKAKEAAEAVEAATSDAKAATADADAPSWGDILAELGHLANDRKIDWAQQLLARLQTQIDRFDADMAAEHGDRYGFLRPLVQGLRSLVALAYGKVASPAETDAPTPVSIAVLDETDTSVDAAVDDSGVSPEA